MGPAAPPERWRSLVAAALCSALLAACATTQAPPDSGGLDGQWRLNAAASDNVALMVSQAVSKAEAKLRKRRGGSARRGSGSANPGGSAPGAGSTGAGNSGGTDSGADSGADEDLDTATDALGDTTLIGPDFQELRDHLTDTLGTSTRLSVAVKPGDVEVQGDDLPPRDYQPGERITRYDEYGTATLTSRWDGSAFELRERYTSGARLVERYDLDTTGTLVYTRILQDPTVGKLTVKSVYNRVSAGG